jgi:hypothetical protein
MHGYKSKLPFQLQLRANSTASQNSLKICSHMIGADLLFSLGLDYRTLKKTGQSYASETLCRDGSK